MGAKKAFKTRAIDKGRIKVTPNGPYEVTGGIPLREHKVHSDSQGFPDRWQEGKEYPSRQSYRLCRCGHSQRKPFCDASHLSVDFDGTETASREAYLDSAKETDGPDLELTDVEDLCVHARFCDRAGGTWELTRRSADRQSRQIAVEEAGNCPSGRLVVWDKDGNEIEPEFEPVIGLAEDPAEGVQGAIRVLGGIPIESADGTTYEIRNRVTLCRCGRSRNKPFCDASHMEDEPQAT